jgi:hypothetical protein
MTTRTFFYLLVVSVAVAVTAVTGSGALLAESPSAVLGVVDPVSTAVAEETSSRWVLLLAGIGLVLVTYRQAYLNFRR